MLVTNWIMRGVLWLVAVFLCLLPIVLSVAKDPSSVHRLIDLSSYLAVGRDIIFGAIAILAIALIDAFDGIVDRISYEKQNTILILWTCMLILGIVIQLICYSYWSASMLRESAEAVTWPYLMVSLTCSFLARLILLV